MTEIPDRNGFDTGHAPHQPDVPQAVAQFVYVIVPKDVDTTEHAVRDAENLAIIYRPNTAQIILRQTMTLLKQWSLPEKLNGYMPLYLMLLWQSVKSLLR